MSRVEVKDTQMGFVVLGDIRFNNVLHLRRLGNRLIDRIADSSVEIDLSHIRSSDTSGLSLLLRWMHYAKKKNKQIHYASIPSSLLNMAKVCGVSDLIGD